MTLPRELLLPSLAEEQPDLAHYPAARESRPSGEIAEGAYAVRCAASVQELDAILRLRYDVFNLELQEGLEKSFLTGRDQDEFDAQCHHLLVEHRPSGRVIGTYRIQTAAMALAGHGFYTGTEFDLRGLPPEIVAQSVEAGRACIAVEHRLKPVLFLLWKGLALYMAHNQKRFLFGPCSLTSQDPWEAKRVLDHLERKDLVRREVAIGAMPGFECVWEGDDPEPEKGERIELPPLFEIYLRYGGRTCGPPVIDRRFKTIDFFILFDVEALSPRARRVFFG